MSSAKLLFCLLLLMLRAACALRVMQRVELAASTSGELFCPCHIHACPDPRCTHAFYELRYCLPCPCRGNLLSLKSPTTIMKSSLYRFHVSYVKLSSQYSHALSQIVRRILRPIHSCGSVLVRKKLLSCLLLSTLSPSRSLCWIVGESDTHDIFLIIFIHGVILTDVIFAIAAHNGNLCQNHFYVGACDQPLENIICPWQHRMWPNQAYWTTCYKK